MSSFKILILCKTCKCQTEYACSGTVQIDPKTGVRVG